jgi:flagellar operon protein
MTDKVTVGQLYPGRIPPLELAEAAWRQQETKNSRFQEIFQQKLLQFSQHAKTRLEQRGIHLRPEQLARIEEAIDKAQNKGAKDSLIVLQDIALIVNVKNRTVVTALDESSMKEHVFTHIDSAIIVK